MGAACTLVWAAWSGSWGRAGHKSQDPPKGVGRGGGKSDPSPPQILSSLWRDEQSQPEGF